MQRVPALGFGERELVLHAPEHVGAVDDAIRPRRESRPTEVRPHLVGGERDDEIAPLVGQRTEGGAHAGDGGFVAVGAEDDGGSGHSGGHGYGDIGHPAIISIPARGHDERPDRRVGAFGERLT